MDHDSSIAFGESVDRLLNELKEQETHDGKFSSDDEVPHLTKKNVARRLVFESDDDDAGSPVVKNQSKLQKLDSMEAINELLLQSKPSRHQVDVRKRGKTFLTSKNTYISSLTYAYLSHKVCVIAVNAMRGYLLLLLPLLLLLLLLVI